MSGNRTWVDDSAQTFEIRRDERKKMSATVRALFFLRDVIGSCFKFLRTVRHNSFLPRTFRGAKIYSSIKDSTIVVSQRLPFPIILCLKAPRSAWALLACRWFNAQIERHAFLTKKSIDIKTIKPCQLLVRPWCERNLRRLLLQVHITIVLRYELRYMWRERFYGWQAARRISGNRFKPLRALVQYWGYSLAVFLISAFLIMSVSFFRTYFANISSKDAIIFFTNAPSLSQAVILRCLKCMKQIWAVAPVPIKGLRTIAPRLVDFLRICAFIATGFCSGQNMGPSSIICEQLVNFKDRFR